MKILLVGVLDVSWSTNCAMQRELEKLGHKVVPFNYRTIASEHASKRWYSDTKIDVWLDKTASYLRRDSWIPFRLDWYFHRKGRSKMNQVLIETVRKGNFDLVLISKTDSVDYRLVDEINTYAQTWYFFMDPMDQAYRINAKEYARRATWVSATFSDVTKHFQQVGARVYWLPQGIDTELFSPAVVEKTHDVVFVGTKNPKRADVIERLRQHGVSVTCCGEGWENPPVYLNELVNLYRRTKIALNICRPGAGFSVRVFQVVGAGTFLLSEFCLDLAKIFEPGVHLDWFKSEQEMIEKIDYYLSNESLRGKIAKKGNTYVHNNYSWKIVMHRIIKYVSSGEKRQRVELS